MKGQDCMIFCYAVIVMLLKLLYVELGYTDHRFRFKNVDKNGRIYRKESCVNFFFFLLRFVGFLCLKNI